MGLSLTATIVESPDGLRVDLDGEGGDVLVRRRGEALNALQQIVASVFRDELPEGQRLAVDCLGFRQGKDAELRTMALFLADKAASSGTPQEVGPLNPYERRIVHMAVTQRSDVTTESIGDAFMKIVVISAQP
jgi:spoIIIJ-associated protein